MNRNYDIKKQTALFFTWDTPVYYKRAFLIPKKKVKDWDKDGNEGFVHSLNQNLTANGGKIAVFRVSVMGKTGYMIFDGYDELNRFFNLTYM
jgi:glycine cleavage system aminomethyltransferase T